MNKSAMAFFAEPLSFKQIVFNGICYSPDQINREIDKLASYFTQNNFSGSLFIHLFAHNHIKTIITYFAILRSNHICVLIDPDMTSSEHKELLQDTPPFAIVRLDKETESLNYQNEIILCDHKNYSLTETQLDNVCMIVYTAAEDGFLKGSMLTYANILSNTQAIIDCDRITEDSVCCAMAPFSHLYGLQTGVLSPILGGASFVIEDISNLRRLKKSIQNISEYNITNVYSVPMVYYLMCKYPDIRKVLKDTFTLASGGYTLPKSIFDSFLQKTGKKICNGYGLTEASPVCAWQRPDDVVKQGSVGKPFLCCDVEIRDRLGNTLPVDTIGEICVKGNNVMKGYYNKNKTTTETIVNGWLKTGDQGKIDCDGYVFITGLKKNMFNIGGRNVYPTEILRLMKQCDNVAHVLFQCSVSEIQGHFYTVDVDLKINTCDEQEKFKKHCREKISRYKLPKEINFIGG